MKKLSSIVTLCVTILCGGTAKAVEPTVVILKPQHNLPGDPERVLSSITERIGTALGGAGYALVPADQAATCVASEGGATDPTHLSRTAGECEAQAAAGVQVDASAMGYAMRLLLVGSDGTVVADLQGSCDFCTEGEMVDRWSELVGGVGAPTPALIAAAEAAQGGGSVEPVAPVEPVEPVDEGAESSVSVSDIPWWVWAGGAASLALIGGSIPLLVIDGDPTCDGPLETCPEIYNTDAAGYTLLAVGIAGLGAVGVGLYLVLADDEEPDDAEGEAEPEAELALFPSLGGLVLRGVFGP